MEALVRPPTVEGFSMSGGLLPGLAAQQPASPAQLVVGRPILLNDAIAGRIRLAPLVPVPNLVPDLVLESPPIAGHQTPPRYATTTRGKGATKLSGNKRGISQAGQKESPPMRAGRAFAKARVLRTLSTGRDMFRSHGNRRNSRKKRGRPPAAMETDPCQRAAAGWGWGEVPQRPQSRLSLSDFQLRVDPDRAGEVVEIG